MSTRQFETFQIRVRRISRRHDRMTAYGATPKLGKDGLVVMRPKRNLPRPGLRSLCLLAMFAFGFKVFTYSALGAEDYAARLSSLDEDGTVARAGAFVMQPDPATLWVHEQLMALRARVVTG